MPAAIPAAIIGGAVIGGAATAYSGNKAASAQKKAAAMANDTQKEMFYQIQENLAPYMELGGEGVQALKNRLMEFTSPIIMDQAALEKTPGYQFTRDQGLKAVQNSAAARGLANSGAALKGAANFATGLADTTYQKQFANSLLQQQNAFERLMGITSIGQNAAAGVGNAGIETGRGIANNLIGAGNASAANFMNTGNAISGAANSVGSGLLTNQLLNQGIYSNPSSSSGAGLSPGEANLLSKAGASGY